MQIVKKLTKNPIILSLFVAATLQAGQTAVRTSAPAAASVTSSDSVIRPCLCHGAFAGSEKPLAFNISTGYDSNYYCRGLDVGQDLWHATATVDYRINDRATWTTSIRYHDVADANFEEIQAYTGIFFRFGNLSVGPSFRWYEFKPGNTNFNAYDLGVQALYKAGPVNLHAGYFYETESEGSYAEFGVSATIKVHDRVSLVPSAQVSYTDGWLVPALSGMNMVDLRLSIPVKLTDEVTLTPYIGGFIALEALEAAQDDKIIAGASLSVTF